MGTDNLHHKRKAKSVRDLRRKQARRAPYAKALIVCEGEKTEPLYFQGLKDYYRLNNANIEICGDCDSEPLSIYSFAKQRFREERDAGDPFDRVYCVFDKDSHASYERALELIKKTTPKDTFFATVSVPCFEYWLLLHFNYSTKPYSPLPGRSTAQQVTSDLEVYYPGYRKGNPGVFSNLVTNMEFAKKNAARGLEAARRANTDNPSTTVHELVAFLESLNKS